MKWILMVLVLAAPLAAAQEGNAKLVTCSWDDDGSQDYFGYRIDDAHGTFEFTTSVNTVGADGPFSRVPHKENAVYKEELVNFSRTSIEHCRTKKSTGLGACYRLDRVAGMLIKTRNRADGTSSVERHTCRASAPETKF